MKPTKFGGIDPSVIRELSGIYKPFVNALKELISNAYDADADLVQIRLADNFKEVEITDDGIGMSPLEFQNDFTKIGGSYKRLQGGWTAKGRPKIGSKGIGFLAVARYCSSMEVISTTTRIHRAKVRCLLKRKRIDLLAYIGASIPRELLLSRLLIHSITLISGERRKKLAKKHNELESNGFINLRDSLQFYDWNEVEVEYSIDCRDLEFAAVIDFGYLLSLENKKNLEEIEDFCSIKVYALPKGDPRVNKQHTKIRLMELKDFVVRDLKRHRKHGNVRNIDSRSGLESFLWHLRRCTPIRYQLPAPIKEKFGKKNLESTEIKYIDKAVFSHSGDKDLELTRPVWISESDPISSVDDDMSVEVIIDSDGLMVRGYIQGSSEIIYPAEYRGIAVRVRNVQIGIPSFLGFENIATGSIKAALSQITGEINVLKGMDAIDALNPGRESFYEETPHFKLLKSHILGDKEVVGGLLGKVIKGILTRSMVVSAINDQVVRANQRRKTLLNLSYAITHYSRLTGAGEGLRQLFRETTNLSNGLMKLPKYEIGPAKSIHGFRIDDQPGLEEDHQTDFTSKKVYFNFKHDRWSWRVSILGDLYEIVPKDGDEKDPLCQLDTSSKRVYINWGHPLRQQMGDAAFMKSAIAWKIAFHASQGQIENMMDLALKILAYTES